VPLLFLESIGTTELVIIMLVALVVFGPRRLPDLARSLGKSLNSFKLASDDFKQTWELEAASEGSGLGAAAERPKRGGRRASLSPPTEERDAVPEAPQGSHVTPPQTAAVEGGSHVETPALAAGG
jgi:sec-independent protein translocase protein TatB